MGAEPRRATLLQRLQLPARFEADRFAGRDRHLRAGPRVAANAGLAGADVEDAEASQFNALPMRQRSLHALENRFHRHLGLGLGYPGLIYYFINDIELDHESPSRLKTH